jgi:SAM-dependent methyltransferase
MVIGIDLCFCHTNVSNSKIVYRNLKGFNIVQCNNCGQIYTNPFPTTLKNVADIYNGDYLIKKNKKEQLKYMKYARFNLNDFTDLDGKRMLDIGPGGGETLVIGKQSGAEVCGFEINPVLSSHLRAQGFTIYNDINKIPNDFFDYITMTMVLEHIPDPYAYLIAVKSKLKENGKLRINVPDFNSIPRKLFKKYWSAFCPDQHLWFFTENSLSLLLQKVGYKIELVHKDSLGKGIDEHGKITYDGFECFFNSLGNIFVKLVSIFLLVVDKLTFQKVGAFIRKSWDNQGDQLTIIVSKNGFIG